MKNIFWIYNPLTLIDKNKITNIWPKDKMKYEEKLNAITRLIIMLTILGYLITRSINIAISGFITIILIIFYYKNREGLDGTNNNKLNIIEEKVTNIESEQGTRPNINNPLMNVMLNEIGDNPQRGAAKDSFDGNIYDEINNVTKKQIINNSGLDNRLFNDSSDAMEFEHSMRNFYTTANTEIPNAQDKFSQWCYGSMTSRKDGEYI
jgi:hypothetical protein